MKKILFVCLGNICRSPTAEAVFRHKLQQQGLTSSYAHDSCGTAAYHQGKPPDKRAVSAAEERDYKMSDLRARRVEERDFETFDLILAMDRMNQIDLLSLCPQEFKHKIRLFLEFGSQNQKEVPDPYYGGHQGFNRVLNLVEDACDGLLESLESGILDE